MTALSRGQPEDVDIFPKYVDLVRFPAAQYGDDLVRYLRSRYAARKPDVDRGREFSAGTGACTPRRALCGRADCFCECGLS